MLSLSINITPKPAPRPRLGAFGNVYMPDWYKQYVETISNCCIISGKFILVKPIDKSTLKLDITFRKNLPVTRRQFGDIDNLVKGVMDALTGIAYKDDSQVTEVYARKFQSDNEGIDFCITYL